MRHLNKQLEVNHHALEHYLEEQDRQEELRNKLDRFGLGLMIICGLLGLFYTTTEAGSLFQRKQGASSATVFARNGTNAAPIAKAAMVGAVAHSGTTANLAEKVVQIEGLKHSGQPLQFTIDSFHPAATYEFNFGNGHTALATQHQVQYAYDRAGTYEVQLKVTFEGESKIAYTDILTIQ